MNRREFLKSTAAMAALYGIGGCAGVCCSGKPRLGVQMFSVKDLWPKDLAASFKELKSIGYEGVQGMYFWKNDRKELKAMLDGNGLRLVDMPVSNDQLAPGKESEVVDFLRFFDIDFIYVPWAKFKTYDEWKKYADDLGKTAERFAKYGIKLGFHNHFHELAENFGDEQICSQEIIARVPNIQFELDIGRIQGAGADPVAWMKRLHGRVPTIHASPEGASAIGDKGDIVNWKGVLEECVTSGTKWVVVECEKQQDTYDPVRRSYARVKNLILNI